MNETYDKHISRVHFFSTARLTLKFIGPELATFIHQLYTCVYDLIYSHMKLRQPVSFKQLSDQRSEPIQCSMDSQQLHKSIVIKIASLFEPPLQRA